MIKHARQILLTLLKSAFSIGIATLLLHLTIRKCGMVPGGEDAPLSLQALVEDAGAIVDLFSKSVKEPAWLGLAVSLYFAILLLVNWRWQALLRGIGLRVPYGRVFQMGLVGLFFNIALPGSVSGDVVKIAYVIRESPDKRTPAALSVLLDRILGLCGLLTLSVFTLLLSIPILLKTRDLYVELAVLVIIVGIGGMAAGTAILFNIHRIRDYANGHPGLLRFKAWLPHFAKMAISKVVHALDLYRQAPRYLLLGLLKSIAVHLLLATIILSLIRSLGVHIPWLGCALCAQIGEIAGMIPLAPAGIGLRDYVNSTLLQSLGVHKDYAGSAAVLFTCILATWSLVGAVCFIFFRRRHKEHPPQPR